MELLKTKNLEKYFGNVHAVDDVTIAFQEDSFASIIGPNGAGKSTFFNLITGELKPDSGRVEFKDMDITDLPPHEIVKLGIGRSFQIANLFPELSVRENVKAAVSSHMGKSLDLLSSIDTKDINEKTNQIMKKTELFDLKNKTCATISHGDIRRLEIVLALAIEPDLLLLDEPTAGMSPKETEETKKFMKELSSTGSIAIILIEHDMDVVFSIAERILVMHQGSIIADGTPEEVKGEEKVRTAYLGE